MKLVVAGYYGCGNLGDDALLLGLLNGLDGRHEITALSGNPDRTAADFGVAAVARKDIRAATRAIRDADALVFGGGGLLQDTTSLLSLKYYTHLITVAARARKKVALLGQGIGPIRSVLGKRAAGKAFSQCGLITTRDEGSMRLVEQLVHHARGKRAVTDDLAWLSATPKGTERRRAIAVSARPWKDSTPKIVSAFRDFCERAVSEGWEILPASFDRSTDDAVLDEIAPGTPTDLRVDNLQALVDGMASVSATVSMRLHGGIFSVAAGIAPTMVSYDEKVTAFARSIGQAALPLKSLTGESLWAAFQATEANRPDLEREACVRRELGLRRSRMNIEMLESFLQGGRT